MENQSIELKPCPFGGGKAKLWHRRRQQTKYAVGCMKDDCYAWVPADVRLSALHNYAPCFRYLTDAVNSWNIRAMCDNRKLETVSQTTLLATFISMKL